MVLACSALHVVPIHDHEHRCFWAMHSGHEHKCRCGHKWSTGLAAPQDGAFIDRCPSCERDVTIYCDAGNGDHSPLPHIGTCPYCFEGVNW